MESPDRGTVVVITNGNVFAARGLRRLLINPPSGVQVVSVVTRAVAKRAPGRSRLQLVRRWGWRYFGFKLVVNVVLPALAVVCRRPETVTMMSRRVGTRLLEIGDINAPEGLAMLREIAPDVVVSFSCPYRIGDAALAIAKVANLNVHSSLLPAYAGVSTYVHVLAHGERTTGVTVHEMVERFDAGLVVAQRPVEVPSGTSACDLFRQLCDEAADLLHEAVAGVIRKGEVVGTPQDLSKRSYFADPGPAEVSALRGRGFRLMRARDVFPLMRAAT